eukprot:1139894-Pelagomonas_calceolata.AAC.2
MGLHTRAWLLDVNAPLPQKDTGLTMQAPALGWVPAQHQPHQAPGSHSGAAWGVVCMSKARRASLLEQRCLPI